MFVSISDLLVPADCAGERRAFFYVISENDQIQLYPNVLLS